MPFARGALSRMLAAVRAARLPLWLLDPRGSDLFSLSRGPSALVLAVGSEGTGASEALRAASDVQVSIPLLAGVESLNAAVAVGIALSHLVRLPAAPAAARPVPARRGRPR